MLTAATIQGFTDSLRSIVSGLVPLLSGVALLYFVWGMVTYIAKSGSEDGQREGQSKMIWGVVALFVIIAVWGLVGFIADSFKIDATGGMGDITQFK